MELQLDPHGKLPVYRQLVDQTRFAINTGKLKAGDKLPSLRAIAARHGIAINTVVKAFKALERQGLIAAGARSAYRVVPQPGVLRPLKKTAGDADRYAKRGVSANKSEVHRAIRSLDKGLFPQAFCKITEDYLTLDPDRCNVIHSDGCGTKSILAYLSYRESGDAAVFRGIAQDSIVMNLDDLLCVGATGRILISNTINRNAKRIGADVLKELILGTEEFLSKLRGLGVDVHSGGGETADVGDLTPTLTVDSCATAVMDKAQVITGDKLRPGLAIVGLSSTGRASYEESESSGIGSNGLTSARHDLLKGYYAKKYPETFDKQTDRKLVYCGPYKLEDRLPGSNLTVGEALLSPTRSYAPVVFELLRQGQKRIKAILHCSGGGQTKCLKFGRGLRYVKNELFAVPPVFKAIQRASKTSDKEMFQVYNMGHRMEIFCGPRDVTWIQKVASSFGIEAKQIGYTEASGGSENELILKTGAKKLTYRANLDERA